MNSQKHREHGSKEKDKMKNDDEEHEDVIATIHVLKNKERVKKRVVTRHNKND